MITFGTVDDCGGCRTCELRNLRPALFVALAALLLAAGPDTRAGERPRRTRTKRPRPRQSPLCCIPAGTWLAGSGRTTPVCRPLRRAPGASARLGVGTPRHRSTTRDDRYAWPGRQDEFPMLTPGLGLWLLPQRAYTMRCSWTRSAVTDGSGRAAIPAVGLEPRRRGQADNGTEVDEAVARFGDSVRRVGRCGIPSDTAVRAVPLRGPATPNRWC